MSPSSGPSVVASSRAQEGRRVLMEGWVIAFAGVLFGLLANAVSPRGLSFVRNYFPEIEHGTDNLPAATAQSSPDAEAANASAGPQAAAVARIQQRGFKVAGLDEVTQWFHEPAFTEERIIFIDARKDDAYTEGHIPGAYQLDHYYPEKYLPDVLPAAQSAETVLIYCTGGECEDSEFTAVLLRDAGVPSERLQVFAGGITEWRKHELPIEVGARHSGVLREPATPPSQP
jgi:rhodanese-related sulfurtransferase